MEEFQGAWESLGNRPINIYKYFGNTKSDFSKVTDGIFISSLGLLYQHSLSKQSQFFEMAKKVDMVIMDEAHQAIAPTYEHLLRILMPTGKTKFLGLSATPGRGYLSAEQDIELAQFFNRQKVELEIEGYDNPIDFLTENGYLAKVDYEKLDYSGGELTEKELEYLNNFYDISPQTLVKISKDKARNLILVKRIAEEAKEGKKIIVFACSVEHAYLLQNLLQLNGFKTAAITSDTSTELRTRLIKQYKDTDEIQILTNFGVLTTGFDAPKTSVAVIARPTLSLVLFSQMVGRAIRGVEAGGNKEAKVITIVDTEIPGFNSVAEAFKFWNDIWD
jgi:superfamily II DNA or RNA helicase